MKTTQLIIAANVLLFGVMVLVAGTDQLMSFDTATLLRFGANDVTLLREGQWWRLVSAMFIHMSPLHLGMNMLALYQCGALLEPHFGRERYMLVYIVAGVCGAAASAAWHWHHPVVSAGASGAIGGLIGAGIVSGHLIGSRRAIEYRNAMVQWAVGMLLFGVFAHADHAAHVGGLVSGALVAWLVDRGGAALIERPQHDSPGIESLILFALVGGSFALAARAQSSAHVDGVDGRGDRRVEAVPVQNVDDTIANFRRELRFEPDNAVAHLDLAAALSSKEQYAEAAEHARRATELDPHSHAAFVILSICEQKLGHAAAAEAARQAALRLGPEDPPAGE